MCKMGKRVFSGGLKATRLGSAVTDSRPFADGPGEERNIFVFSEVLAKHFAHQLADGIAYIHSLGAQFGARFAGEWVGCRWVGWACSRKSYFNEA